MEVNVNVKRLNGVHDYEYLRPYVWRMEGKKAVSVLGGFPRLSPLIFFTIGPKYCSEELSQAH